MQGPKVDYSGVENPSYGSEVINVYIGLKDLPLNTPVRPEHYTFEFRIHKKLMYDKIENFDLFSRAFGFGGHRAMDKIDVGGFQMLYEWLYEGTFANENAVALRQTNAAYEFDLCTAYYLGELFGLNSFKDEAISYLCDHYRSTEGPATADIVIDAYIFTAKYKQSKLRNLMGRMFAYKFLLTTAIPTADAIRALKSNTDLCQEALEWLKGRGRMLLQSPKASLPCALSNECQLYHTNCGLFSCKRASIPKLTPEDKSQLMPGAFPFKPSGDITSGSNDGTWQSTPDTLPSKPYGGVFLGGGNGAYSVRGAAFGNTPFAPVASSGYDNGVPPGRHSRHDGGCACC